MKESPFVYGSTVSSKSFANREKDTEKLYQNLTQGINTAYFDTNKSHFYT